MAIIATEKGKSNFPIMPEGQYIAICYAVIDEGEQYSELFQKTSRKVRIMWEVPDQQIEIDGEMQPRVLNKEYTLSLGEKSNLRKDLIGWRGKAFTSEELDGFDLKNILDKPCMLQIIHETKREKTYANISGIFAVPKGMAKPIRTNNLVYLDWESDEFESQLSAIPEWAQDIVKKSETWKERLEYAAKDKLIDESVDIDDEDLPF